MQPFRSPRNRFTRNSSRRGDAVKVIIITVCVFVMIMLLLCGGAGIYGYVWFQKNFSRLIVQTPADIQKITAEITDIDIPPQFTPIMGSAVFGMKTVTYAWNPKAVPLTMTTWNNAADPLHPMFNLVETTTEQSTATGKDFQIPDYQQKALSSQYVEFTHSIQEFTIRGHKCQFLFVTGRPKEGAFEGEEMLYDELDEEEMMVDEKPASETSNTSAEDKPADAAIPDASPAATPTEATAEPSKPTEPATKALAAVRSVSGQFPGKSGAAMITIRIPAEGSDEDVLLKIIQSIH